MTRNAATAVGVVSCIGALWMSASPLFADETVADSAAADSAAASDPEIVAIQKKYADRISDMQAKATTAGNAQPTAIEKAINVQVTTKSVRHEIKLDLPDFKMKMLNASFNVPEVRSTRLVEKHFSVPETYTAVVVCGRYPKCTKVRNFPPKIDCHMEDIKCTTVRVRQVDHVVKFSMPVFGVKKVDIKTLVPVISGHKELRVVYDLPDVAVHSAASASTTSDKELTEAATSLNQVVDAMQTEIKGVAVKRVAGEKAALLKTHDDTLTQIDQAIKSAHDANIDPANVPVDGGPPENLLQRRLDIEAQFHAAIVQFDAAIAAASA